MVLIKTSKYWHHYKFSHSEELIMLPFVTEHILGTDCEWLCQSVIRTPTELQNCRNFSFKWEKGSMSSVIFLQATALKGFLNLLLCRHCCVLEDFKNYLLNNLNAKSISFTFLYVHLGILLGFFVCSEYLQDII